MTCFMKGYCGIWRLTVNVVILGIAIFDLVADWIVFSNFWQYAEGSHLTNAILAFCIIASLLFILEIRNAVEAVRIFRIHLFADLEGWQDGELEEGVEDKGPPKRSVDTEDAEKSLSNWQETVSFMLLAWEDLPITIILFLAFIDAEENCELYREVFKEGIIANLALLATFVSATWKLGLSLFFCCCKCLTCEEINGCKKESCCCCCRLFRPLLAVLLMSFSGYLYFRFNEDGDNVCRVS